MITNNNGPLRTVQDIGVQIARGQVSGARPEGSFGELTTTGADANRIIWPNGVFKIPDAAGIDIDIVSSNVNDIDGGSGINSIEVHYLDVELNEQSETILLDGTTPVVDAITGVRFINCMHIQLTGTNGQGAVGDIKAYVGAQIYSEIKSGDVRCSSSARMVPKDKRMIVAGIVGSAISGTAAARALIQIVATELGNHQYTEQGLFMPFGSIGLQDSSEGFNLPVPLPFKEGTVIAMFLKTTDKAAIITGDWFGWIEDK
jgi:hypothetical protein